MVFGGISFAAVFASIITYTLPERDTVVVATASVPLIDLNVLEHGANLAELERGRVYYAQLCVSCHGARGKGFGPWAYRVKPRPSNLTSMRVQQRSDEYLFKVISNGQSNSPMVGWKDRLSIRQRWQLVGFLRHLATQQVPSMQIKL